MPVPCPPGVFGLSPSTLPVAPSITIMWLARENAVETRADLNLPEHRQRLQIEHGDGLVAAVRREAVTSLGSDAGAMHTRRVRNVAKHFACGAFDHHHVAGTGNEHAARGGFDGDVVRAALAFDVEFFNLERLRVPDAGRGKDGCEENRKCYQ